MTSSPTLDVAVVGYGPVGVAAAALAASRGMTVEAFERERDVYHLPRAAHFDGEIMRVWQEIGAAERVLPCTAPGAGMHFLNADGVKLFGVDADAEAGPQGWARHYMFYQPDLERVLRARAQELGVAAHLGHEVESLEQADGHVALHVRDLASSSRRVVRARWVLGCDGGRSLSRTAIGAELEDLCFDQPWLVVDTVLRRHVELPRMAVQYCDPRGPVTFIPMAGMRRRWEFMLLPEDTPASMERPERVRELLGRWVRPDDVEVVRAVVYTFHALVVRPWRRGRVFLLGDAAHQMPPFLGQGMCSGIRDAANLTWKLDLVRRGVAGDGLLDSYETERAPHVRMIIGTCVAAGNVIQTTDPEVAAMRDRQLLGETAPPIQRDELPPLTAGLLHGGGRGPGAGKLVPQPRCAGGEPLDERLGRGFAVVSGEDPARAMTRASLAFWQKLGARLVATRALDGWLAEQGASAVVVRPDRYAYGVACAPGDLDGLTGALRAALA
ncbi:MAG: bifunctional 3-(3-hydroxy-phenyl)propionate/3-hydroxycinnamic acid hydroxylase [Thermodesulfobacteriota bacterium]